MYRIVIAGVLFFLLLGNVAQAQTQFSIRAASDESVPGWNPMQLGNQTIWVSPASSLTPADILRATPEKGADGRTSVGIVFNETGTRKMKDLSVAQMNKRIAFVLDGTLIFAPRVRSEIGSEAQLTGNGPNGVAPSVVDRIVSSVNKK